MYILLWSNFGAVSISRTELAVGVMIMDYSCKCKLEVRQLYSCKIWNYFVGNSKIIQLLDTLAHTINKIKQVPALLSLQVQLLSWGSVFCTTLLIPPLSL